MAYPPAAEREAVLKAGAAVCLAPPETSERLSTARFDRDEVAGIVEDLYASVRR